VVVTDMNGDAAEAVAGALIDKGAEAFGMQIDVTDEAQAREAVNTTADEFGRLDTVVNNIATQEPYDRPEQITDEKWLRTFEVNVHSYFRITRAALAHLPAGGSIVNTGSVNGLRGNKNLIDYSATKGAVQSLTYSLAQSLLERGIRVNCVAPGPVWTPLIPATMPPEKVESFGAQTPMGRAAHPDEIAPSYVFFAAPSLSSYYTGEVLAPVGGETMPG